MVTEYNLLSEAEAIGDLNNTKETESVEIVKRANIPHSAKHSLRRKKTNAELDDELKRISLLLQLMSKDVEKLKVISRQQTTTAKPRRKIARIRTTTQKPPEEDDNSAMLHKILEYVEELREAQIGEQPLKDDNMNCTEKLICETIRQKYEAEKRSHRTKSNGNLDWKPPRESKDEAEESVWLM